MELPTEQEILSSLPVLASPQQSLPLPIEEGPCAQAGCKAPHPLPDIPASPPPNAILCNEAGENSSESALSTKDIDPCDGRRRNNRNSRSKERKSKVSKSPKLPKINKPPNQLNSNKVEQVLKSRGASSVTSDDDSCSSSGSSSGSSTDSDDWDTINGEYFSSDRTEKITSTSKSISQSTHPNKLREGAEAIGGKAVVNKLESQLLHGKQVRLTKHTSMIQHIQIVVDSESAHKIRQLDSPIQLSGQKFAHETQLWDVGHLTHLGCPEELSKSLADAEALAGTRLQTKKTPHFAQPTVADIIAEQLSEN
mmetsp:Transcript_7291/g.12109  ORF Transcript_7291/g.12109 Transcript_7291/m.12109 type:complete len:309 (+) Transcript_7291:54-980(+)|eukprot:CAMPEP_0174982622 /NCGR_PEP_ID=MMETSP0004_2-20121128/16621_1 /TAXON_ID=420556 /ORGANISM="Ochromonas sp., Strain CCMP1393" /LENGTH=308 /DNA_ID=CAMNT_0016234645 /DNA_START=1 /DNA_END=927 /DNA_ORIENTATION=+